ncbi:unnamed protein product [Closterium sp. NIES-53]
MPDEPGSPESNPEDLEGGTSGHGGGEGGSSSVREQDRFLPIANISRIMKKALPQNAKIAKDAKETVQECVSEFISFITSEASDKCQREKRKTINGDDLLWAMSTLGFEDYVEPLKVYLHRYREVRLTWEREGQDGRASELLRRRGSERTGVREGADQLQWYDGVDGGRREGEGNERGRASGWNRGGGGEASADQAGTWSEAR